jgi:hypothetical protein
LDCGFHTGLANGFGLERGMSVTISVSSVPEGVVYLLVL